MDQADKEPIPHDVLNIFVRRAMGYLGLNNEGQRSIRNHSLPVLEKTSNSETGSLDNTLYIGDTGASTHMGYCDKGMYNVKHIKGNVQVGNGNVLSVNKIGDKKVTAIHKDGSTQDLILKDYKYVPNLTYNLFSLTKPLSNGWELSNMGKRLLLRKGKRLVKFDHQLNTDKGYPYSKLEAVFGL